MSLDSPGKNTSVNHYNSIKSLKKSKPSSLLYLFHCELVIYFFRVLKTNVLQMVLSKCWLGVHVIWSLKGLWGCKTWPLITLRAGLLTVLEAVTLTLNIKTTKTWACCFLCLGWPYLIFQLYLSFKFTSFRKPFLELSHSITLLCYRLSSQIGLP